MRQFRFGEGCFIDSSLMKSAAAFQGGKLMEWIFSNGAPPVLYMPAGSYKTSNGYIMVSAMRPHHFRLMFELIGREDIADDPELQSHKARIRNAPKIIKALQETMPSKTTEEWIAILQPKDVFCERVNNYTDYLEHPHVKESGAIDWIEQERVGRLPVANIAGLPRASEHAPQQHAPHIGEDGPDILGELGYSAAEIDAIFSRGGVRRARSRCSEGGGLGADDPAALRAPHWSPQSPSESTPEWTARMSMASAFQASSPRIRRYILPPKNTFLTQSAGRRLCSAYLGIGKHRRCHVWLVLGIENAAPIA